MDKQSRWDSSSRWEKGSDREVAYSLESGELGREAESLDAATEEEIDALRLDLTQDDSPASTDGSGRVADELAEERLAELTEVGPYLEGEGAVSITPGREETGASIRSHHPNSEIARSEAVVEGNLEESQEESRVERKVDEGTAA